MRHRTPPTIKPGMTEEEYQDEIADYLDACEGDREEREKVAAVEAERRRQEEAERQRQVEIDRINAEADRRAADLANRNRVHLEIRDYLIAHGIEDDVAATVVSLLSLGCPHVEVKY